MFTEPTLKHLAQQSPHDIDGQSVFLSHRRISEPATLSHQHHWVVILQLNPAKRLPQIHGQHLSKQRQAMAHSESVWPKGQGEEIGRAPDKGPLLWGELRDEPLA